MSAPRVGVVVAAYNAEGHLAEALGSLSGQTEPSWTCVVVDDGSVDATSRIAEAAARDEPRIRLVTQANAGVGAARNAGLAALPAGTEAVCFLDSDDLLVARGLEVMLGELDRRPDAVAATGWADTIDGDGRPVEPGHHRATQSERMAGAGLRVRRLGPGEDTTFESLAVYGTIWPPATALIRRDVAVAVGGFDESLPSQEDWDLFLRASRRGPIAFVDRQVAWYRRHEGNVTMDLATNRYCTGLVRAKAWAAPDNTPAQRRCLLAAGVRLNAWQLGRRLRSAIRAISEGRRDRVEAECRLVVHDLAQLAKLRPVAASRKQVERVVALEADSAGGGA